VPAHHDHLAQRGVLRQPDALQQLDDGLRPAVGDDLPLGGDLADDVDGLAAKLGDLDGHGVRGDAREAGEVGGDAWGRQPRGMGASRPADAPVGADFEAAAEVGAVGDPDVEHVGAADDVFRLQVAAGGGRQGGEGVMKLLAAGAARQGAETGEQW
jgi:hypothetical protein